MKKQIKMAKNSPIYFYLKPKQVKDNEWVEVSKQRICCDCGLTHNEKFKVWIDKKTKKATVFARYTRNKEMTKYYRKINKYPKKYNASRTHSNINSNHLHTV